jgi:acyl dehydratase
VTAAVESSKAGAVTANGLEELLALAGRALGPGAWLEITQDRVDTFADATGDHQWIHVDPERASSGPFGGTIAHGYLTLSLVIPLMAEVLDVRGVAMGVNYGLDKVRFPRPVQVGSRVRLRGRVAETVEIPGSGVQLVVDLCVEVEGAEKPACVARAVYRYHA